MPPVGRGYELCSARGLLAKRRAQTRTTPQPSTPTPTPAASQLLSLLQQSDLYKPSGHGPSSQRKHLLNNPLWPAE